MKTVLVIEPDTIFKENLLELLEMEGFKVKGAGTIYEAKRGLNTFHPAVIICDEASLNEAFANLREDLKNAHKSASIVIINTDGTNDNFKDADIYLKMPFRDEELLSNLNELTRGKKA